MNEQIATVEKRDDHVEGSKQWKKRDKNERCGLPQRRTVVTGFHDDTTEQEGSTTPTERNCNCDRNVNGSNSDQMSSQADHTRIPAVHRH